MPKIVDLTNQRFTRLLVLKKLPEKDTGGNTRWLCRCDCGNETITITGSLRSNKTRSCGCLVMETNSTHGLTNSSEYGIWRNMRQRCYNPKSKYYKDYGGRGIKVCDEWKDSFEDFYQDMGPRPTINHTLDRKNNDEDYSKENCRWASPIEQQNNRSNNLYYEFDGERKTLADWCRDLRVNYHRVYMRLWKGAEFEAAIDAEINLHHPPS